MATIGKDILKAAEFLRDPWDARNGYIHVILKRSDDSFNQFLGQHAVRPLSTAEKGRPAAQDRFC